jgi:hypothetical protein
MPDYASILQRSIETLPEKTPDMRQAVYERARAALARQLTSVDPPLGPESIELQHRHLEDAILAVETGFSTAAAVESEAPADAAGNGGMPGETALPGDDEQGPADLPAAEREPPPAPDADELERQEPAPPAMAQFEAEPSNKRWKQPKASRAPALIMLVLLALVGAGAAVLYYTQGDTFQALIEDFTGERTAAGTPEADGRASEDDAAPEIAGGGEIDDAPKSEDRLPGGVAAPLEPARIVQPPAETPDAAPVNGGVNESAEETATETTTETAGETIEPAADEPGGSQTAASEAPAAEPPEAETPAAETPAAEAPEATETAAGAAPATEPPVAETPAASDTVDAIPQGLVGQRAIFEEQGAEGAPGKSVTGAVAWSQKTAENGLPAIVGIIELPDRKAVLSLTISKNTDQALPASHLIEIEFRGAYGLIESPLERVPALYLKKTAKSRGRRLAGEAVPVTENLYWIALSDQGDQVSRNLTLLREGAWFGLPMLFKNGRGALISFEKGIPGDQVFEAVLAAWEKPDTGQ